MLDNIQYEDSAASYQPAHPRSLTWMLRCLSLYKIRVYWRINRQYNFQIRLCGKIAWFEATLYAYDMYKMSPEMKRQVRKAKQIHILKYLKYLTASSLNWIYVFWFISFESIGRCIISLPKIREPVVCSRPTFTRARY